MQRQQHLLSPVNSSGQKVQNCQNRVELNLLHISAGSPRQQIKVLATLLKIMVS